MNTNTTNTQSVYTLTKTTLKNGKFQYVVTDQDGNVISNRMSTREYVACTANGSFYFGRLDLIGKGDHGRGIKWNESRLGICEHAAPALERLTAIAYLQQ